MAVAIPDQALVILWAQWRTIRNYLPHANALGVIFSIIVGTIWYGAFSFVAFAVGAVMNDVADPLRNPLLPTTLLLIFLYWQIVPVLMVSMGSSLDLKKLLVYPIPRHQLFAIEVLLRVSTGIEPLIVLAGVSIGLLLNRRVPGAAVLWIFVFVCFNLLLSTGVRDLLARLLSRKHVREVLAFVFVLAATIPSLLANSAATRPVRRLIAASALNYLPWTTSAHLLAGALKTADILALLAWTGGAYLFARRQFQRNLVYDAAEQGGTLSSISPFERFYRFPSLLLPDPAAALIEKEFRVLLRSPRFRLVFIMGFSFGLLIWTPLAFRGSAPNSFLANNYLTSVSVYSLLLLSDALFWNVFGFDRSAAQIYFAAPLKLSTVLAAKNIAGLCFVLFEITCISLVCLLIRLPIPGLQFAETYPATIVIAIFLFAVGNLTSIYNPRAVDPKKSFRRSGHTTQLIMLAGFPLSIAPVALAYAARYAFGSELAYFGVLAASLAVGALVYHVSMESAVEAASVRKERLIAALSRGEGPIEG